MAGAQVGSSDSASLNSLPSWYTNYAQNITNSGLGALATDVQNYKGAVDQNGNPLPRVAGLTPQQNQAQAQVSSNQGNWLPQLNQGVDSLNQASGMVGSAANTFNRALGQGALAANTYSQAGSPIQHAGMDFDSGINYINGATGNYNGAATGFTNSGNTIANQAIPTLNNGSQYINDGGTSLNQASGTLAPASGMATQGGGTIMDPANQAERDAWMNPYTGAMANRISSLANQNLMENVIPNVNSTFVGNGQFGSARDGMFMNNAIRDNQQNISDTQAQMLLQAQNQADSQYSAEKGRQLQGAATLGGLAQVGTGIGNAYGNLANENTGIGNALTNAGQAQTSNAIGQMNLGNARVNQGNSMAGIGNDRVNQGAALTNVANGQGALTAITSNIGNNQVGMGSAMNQIGLSQGQLAQQRQALGINDINALLTTGGLDQKVNQQGLDASLADFYDRRDFPLSTLGGLSSLLPNVSGRVVPDTQNSQISGVPTNTDPYGNMQDILGLIRGVSGSGGNAPANSGNSGNNGQAYNRNMIM